MGWLIAARVVQGCGAALVMPLAVTQQGVRVRIIRAEFDVPILIVEVGLDRTDLRAQIRFRFTPALSLRTGPSETFCPGESVVRIRAQAALSILLIAPL